MGGSLAPGISALQTEMQDASSHLSKHAKPRANSVCSARTSTDSSNSVCGMSEEFAISLVLPLYYTKLPLTKEEVDGAVIAWKSIVNNRSPYFHTLKKEKLEAGEIFPHQVCSEYFAELFYKRLFDVHPHSRGLFRDSKMKMRLYFMSSISAIIDALVEDQDRFLSSLRNMAKVHNRIGVKAVECKLLRLYSTFSGSNPLYRTDGIGCETLMFCIKKCVGDNAYTVTVANAFNKIFSRVLDAILPVVVRYEIELNRKQESGAGDNRTISRVISTDSNAPLHLTQLLTASSSTASLTAGAVSGARGGEGVCPMHNHLLQQQGYRGHPHAYGSQTSNNGTQPNSLENIKEECLLAATEA